MSKHILACIGDVHGRYNSFNDCLTFIEKKREEYSKEKFTLVTVGDYCDRGEQNIKVLDTLMDYQTKYPDSVMLKGNHEEFFIGSFNFDLLDKDSYIRDFHKTNKNVFSIWTYSSNGGQDTVLEILNSEKNSFEKYARWLANLPNRYVIDRKIVITHAPLKDMTENVSKCSSYDVLWNIDTIEDCGSKKWNIHGHIHTYDEHENKKMNIPVDSRFNVCTYPNVTAFIFEYETKEKTLTLLETYEGEE